MTIYMVRHGLALAGVEDLDPGLAELGHVQARLAAEALAQSADAGRLVVSPLRRTQETAVPVAAALGLTPELREEVAEVFDPTMPVEQRRDMLAPFMRGNWSEQPSHLKAWRQRVVDTLVELGLAATASGRDLVVVSHYVAIDVAIGEALRDDRVVPIPMANASITRLDVSERGLTLIEAASTAHLADDQVTGMFTAMAGK